MNTFNVRRWYCEVEVRENKNGDYSVVHRPLPVEEGRDGLWYVGDNFSEDTPIRDVNDYVQALQAQYFEAIE